MVAPDIPIKKLLRNFFEGAFFCKKNPRSVATSRTWITRFLDLRGGGISLFFFVVFCFGISGLPCASFTSSPLRHPWCAAPRISWVLARSFNSRDPRNFVPKMTVEGGWRVKWGWRVKLGWRVAELFFIENAFMCGSESLGGWLFKNILVRKLILLH